MCIFHKTGWQKNSAVLNTRGRRESNRLYIIKRSPYLSDRVNVAVCQQLLLQGAQQLVEVSWLAAVRGGHALLQLITVLLQLTKCLILHNTNTHKSDMNNYRFADISAVRGYLQLIY